MHAGSLHDLKDLGPGDHLCCIYETEEEHRAVLTPFLRQGLERGEKVLYIVDDRTAEVILDYLRKDGLDVEPYLDRGQLSILTRDEAYVRGGTFDPDAMIALLERETKQALAEGCAALRVTGEMSWALRGLPGSERLIDYEAKLNQFLPGRQCLAICQYDRRRFEPAVLLDVLRTHPIAVIGAEVYDNLYYMPPDELRGAEPKASELEHWIRNLAERQRTVNALRESEDRYRSFFHTSMDAVFITSKSGRWIDMNAAAIELFGYQSKEELQEVAIPDLYARPVDRKRHIQTIEEQGFTKNYAVDLRTKDGRIVNTLITSVPVKDDEGNVAGFQGVIRDVTERKRMEQTLRESEERYRSLYNSIRDAILVADTERNIIDCNLAFCDLFGYALDEIEGKKTHYVYESRDEYEQLGEALKEHMGDPNFLFTVHYQKKSGDVFPGETNVFYLRDDTGDVAGFIGLIRDITERRRAEEMLQEYSERLEEMVEERTQELRKTQERLLRREKLAMLGQLAGGVSHELRGPLGAISNGVYFLQMALEEPEPEVKESLEILEREVDRSDKIISSLLGFARTRAPDRRPLDVNEVVEELLSRTDAPPDVEVDLLLDDSLPTILADRDQLNQVFGNLLRNAFQAMPEGGRLVVKTSEVPGKTPRSGEVAISIADTGVGIPEENREKILEPLFSTKDEGVGLGLALSRSIVGAHGGAIEVESEVGKGSTFTVRLPLAGGIRE